MAAAEKTSATQLSLGMDPTDIVAQHSHILHNHNDPTSALDFLSSFTLAKANLVPNQSISPLSETIKDSMDGDMLRVLPDLPSMPGGAPRSGNAFLAESFREMYQGAHKFDPQTPSWTANGDGVLRPGAGDALVVPAREWDFVARYVDLLSRLPLAATVYAFIDFFLINAEEDLNTVEFFDEEEEVEAMIEVESRIVQQRFVGFLVVAAATVAWSLLSYHPVPFNEL